MSWQDDAACKDKPQRWFFPERTEDAAGCYEQARKVCCDCTVVAECLIEAMSVLDMAGFWAGTTPLDRKNLRRGGKFRFCRTCGGPYVMPRRTNDPYCSHLCFKRSYRRSA